MFYTIELALDYDSHPYHEVNAIWHELHKAFLLAGFHADGRRFTINLSPQQARRLARRTMDQQACRLGREGKSLYRYLREFYGYPTTCAENLLVPPSSSIEILAGA